MTVEFKLPELAENVDTVTVTRILIAVGDEVAVDQPVLEVETDKAAAEVPSGVSGKVTEIRAKEGSPLHVGDVVLVVDGSTNGKTAAASKKSEPAESKQAEPEEAKQVESESKTPAKRKKADAESKAPETETPEEASEEVAQETSETPQPEAPAERDENQFVRRRSRGGPVPASPTVRRFAREIGVDINEVVGTGSSGRITEEDVKNYSRLGHSAGRGSTGWQPAASLPLPDFARWGEVERVAMNSIKRRTAENMSQAWTTIPQVTHFERADVTELEKLRKQYAKRVETHGGKLTMTAIIVKVAAAALEKFPLFNASLDVEHHEILMKKYYNIGVAVDTDRGLLVPVIRDANRKNITEIAVELNEMAERARAGKSRLDEMQGGSFTISNLGGIGGTGFTPIVYPPEVAILGVSRGTVEPVFMDGTFQPRTMMPFSVVYDHRVIDGADAARFARWVAEALEQPFLIFLEG